jgi:hypothetical protein
MRMSEAGIERSRDAEGPVDRPALATAPEPGDAGDREGSRARSGDDAARSTEASEAGSSEASEGRPPRSLVRAYSANEGLRARDSFAIRVSLEPEALWERVLAHPKVREAHEPAPEPAPPDGAPFLAARQSEHELRLRHWAGPTDAVSPVVVMELRPDGHGGTLVRGRFENRNLQRRLVDLPRLRVGAGAWIGAGVGATVLALALLASVLIGEPTSLVFSVLVLLIFFTIPSALVFVPGLLIWNAEGRKRFTPPLWELVGELMMPIEQAAVASDRPFRGAVAGERWLAEERVSEEG